MEYELFITTNLSIESSGQLLSNIMSEILEEKQEIEKCQHPYGFEYVYISNKYFSITINIDDEDMEYDLEETNRSYDVDTNLCINIELFSASFRIGWLKLLEMIGKVLQVFDRDMLFTDEYAYPVMKRRGNTLLVNSDLDEYKVKYITKENLERLNSPYLQAKLSYS